MNIHLHLTTHQGIVYHVAIIPLVEVARSPLRAMYDWCRESYGETTTRFDTVHRWYYNSGQFWFRDEPDRTFFLLRWS